MRIAALLLLGLVATTAKAASIAENVTPANTSVEVSQSQVLTARFRDAAGNPAVGETATFTVEACGSFSSGVQQAQVVTDAMGLASVTYVASGETGLSCFVRAIAGAVTLFNIVTYRLDAVVLNIETLAVPNPPLPGRPFTVEAFGRVGNLLLPNVDFTLQVIRGTGNAALSGATGNTGAGRLQVNVFPEDVRGDFELEVDFRGRKRRFPVNAGAIAGSFQDMYWGGGAQNGWGMSLVQHGDTIFAVLFIYGDDGRPTWYVMSGGTWNAAYTVYTGALYSPRGSPFFAYDASRFNPGAAVGELAITFIDASRAVIDYRIGTQVGTREISRQPVGSNLASTRPNRGDMYWGGITQNGWGVAALQQYDAFFVVWFTYDANGLPTWYVLPAGSYAANGHYEGRIYRTTGSRWIGQDYRASELAVFDVGPFRMRLADGVPTALEWTVDTRTGTLPLMRQGF